MNSESNDRYIRWQNYRISQFSFAVNLFLSFGVASLAFAISQKLADGSKIQAALNSVIFWWAISCAFGCAATIVCLLDFRYTAKKIRAQSCFNNFMAKICGPISWGAFWTQISSYIIGAFILLRAVINV